MNKSKKKRSKNKKVVGSRRKVKKSSSKKLGGEKNILSEVDRIEDEIRRGRITEKQSDDVSDQLDKLSDQADLLHDEKKINGQKAESLKKKISDIKNLLDTDTDDAVVSDKSSINKILFRIGELERRTQKGKLSGNQKDDLSDDLDKAGDEAEDLNDDKEISDVQLKVLKARIGKAKDKLDTDDK